MNVRRWRFSSGATACSKYSWTLARKKSASNLEDAVAVSCQELTLKRPTLTRSYQPGGPPAVDGYDRGGDKGGTIRRQEGGYLRLLEGLARPAQRRLGAHLADQLFGGPAVGL